MKLISVIEISRFIENEACFDIACHECDERLKAVCHFVNQRPADYDTDKVVEQIKEYFKGEVDACMEERNIDYILEHNKAVCEIVEKGGVADET